MDFHSLMNMAASKQESKKNVSRYNLNLPAARKEEKPKPKSEVVQKLIKEKEREKAEKEEAERAERERREREERKKNQFRIPKKKPEEPIVDTESFINSLFDDSGVQSDDSIPDADLSDSQSQRKENKHEHSSHSSKHSSSHKEKSERQKDRNNSEKHSSGSSNHRHHEHKSSSEHRSSSSSSKHPDHKSGSSSSKDKGSSSSSSHSSSKNHHSSNHKSSSHSDSHKDDKTSDSKHSGKSSSSGRPKDSSEYSRSSSSSHRHGSSSSKSRETESSSSSKNKESKSSSSSSSAKVQPSSSTSQKNDAGASSSSSVPQRTASDEQPIVLNKHHLKPTSERQAAPAQMSEKEKILARLQAIKERTLAAIHKENDSKGKRMRGGDKSHRKSRGDDKHDDKLKSVEIVKEAAWSDDDDDGAVNNGVPSALDCMLSDRNAKLEKEKIARMAKQAWERATRKDKGDSEMEVKVKKKKHKTVSKDRNRDHHKSRQERENRNNNHKKKDHSLSSDEEPRKSSPKPKKPVIVKHARNHAPPPMDFKSILAMAEQRQKEPTKPLAPIPKKKKPEEERPLTQEEKDRIARKKSREYQDWLKYGGKRPKKNASDEDEEEPSPAAPNHNHSIDRKSGSQSSVSSDKHKLLSGSSKQSFNKPSHSMSSSNHQSQGSSNNKHRNITMNENVLVCGPATSSGEEGSPRRPQESGNPFDRIFSQVHKNKKRPAEESHSAVPIKKGRYLDSEEEEESDLDGFIDDGSDGEADYSKEIQKMFGYDRAKFKYERDEDLSDMEADYATVMKEEKRSAKLGLQEDLEDIRKEQEELKRKAMMRKQMKKGK